MTALDIHVMPEADARRLTERIRYSAMAVRDGMEKLQSAPKVGSAFRLPHVARWGR